MSPHPSSCLPFRMSEDNSAEENVDKHLQKDLDAEENQNVIETLRGKVREKLKNAKINQGEKSSTQLLIDDNVYHWPKTEVSLDEGLLFFMSSGEEGSTLDWYSEQRSINDSYSKHFSLGDHLQTFAEGQDEDFMEEVIFPDLFEVKAEYEDDQEKIKKQQAYIFVPSSAPVVNQRKLPKDMIPRILEDEGFYIQRKPQIYKKTCNKMENRLLTLEEGKCWFEESGEIMSLPSPIRQSWNFRLNTNKGSLNPALKTTYRKAVKPDLESSIRNKMEGQREMYQLDLNIVGLQFSHHPLFNQEQVLCARLLQLYECFQDRQQQNLPQLLYEKLKALTDATKLANENPEIRQLTKKSLQDYYWQISDTKQLYDLERGKDFSLLHSILRTWKQIKFLRQQQGFTSTRVKLQFQRIKMNKCDEQNQEELLGMSETKKETEGKVLENGEKQESFSYLASELEETDIERIKPITLMPQLSFTAELTNLSKCSLHEQKRRAKIQKLKYFIKILYNDKQVSCSSVSPLQFDFKVMFQQIFNIQLICWPETICLEVYEVSKRTSLLAKLYLPLPNNTELKSKTVLEYVEFSSDELVIPAYGEVGSNVPFLLEGNGTEELCLLTSGKLSYSLSWALDENGIPLTPTSQSLRSAYCRVLDLPTYLKSSISCLRHKETIKSVESDEILNEDTVQPFVEVSFQHTVYQTSTASGSHPCWNEEIKVDFISPGHDYSFSSLSKLKDNIYINIFDEMIIEKHEDPYFKSCSSHSHIRKNWLGSIVFPFSALLQQSEISGTFQVNIPPVLLGYTWSKTYVSPKEDNNGQNLKECIFLNIFATIEPQISYVTCNPELDKFSDLTDVLERAQIFKKTCKAMFPNRRITTTVFNSEGIQILVTRYIKALNPPQQFLDMFLHDSSTTLDLIARFVSLIPIVPDILDENDGFDIWMTSERCISLAIGNKEEHAILLCNFFLYFGKKALVLLGTSMLEGQVAYVLTQETNEYLLWNPLTGQCHKQFDPFCPLQSVDCLFDDGNVWFNIQQNNTPMAVHFDYLKESFWKQLLPKNFQGTKPHTIQPEEIIYCETSKSMIEDLKNRIERTLKRKMMEWRPKQPTRWNRQCTYILRKILPTLELGTGSFVSSEEESEFERLLQLYWVTGFPIQMPYTDVESIIDAVYQTGIHSSEFPQTEFALAVYIHPYPNNILSVWVYLASLARYQ
ncbi:protein CC2D2B isoform X18 [Canis lupus baileyi]|uniref:protein CC2D2B isoform X18 n=1 Tax=Canis lupus baileyi TaxID=143281 RepID=UPI003B9786A1